MKKPKRTLLIVSLTLILGVTIYTNFTINNKSGDSNKTSIFETEETKANADGVQVEAVNAENIDEQAALNSQDYFAVFSQDRDNVRSKEIEYLETIINDKSTDKDTLKQAQQQKLALVNAMEKEVTIEGLVKAKGFANAVATFQSGSLNIVVESKELSSAQVAQILDIAKRESGEPAENIRIVPKI